MLALLIEESAFLNGNPQRAGLLSAIAQPNAGFIRQLQGKQLFDALSGRELGVNLCVEVLKTVTGIVFYLEIEVINAKGILNGKGKIQRIVLSPIFSLQFILLFEIIATAAGSQQQD